MYIDHIYIHVHTYTNIHTHKHIYINMQAQETTASLSSYKGVSHTYIHVHPYTHPYTHTHTHIHKYAGARDNGKPLVLQRGQPFPKTVHALAPVDLRMVMKTAFEDGVGTAPYVRGSLRFLIKFNSYYLSSEALECSIVCGGEPACILRQKCFSLGIQQALSLPELKALEGGRYVYVHVCACMCFCIHVAGLIIV
jgi:hypothetical protein